MRWKNLIIVVIITAVTALFTFIFISPLVKMAIEKSATAALGAKVEFASLKVHPHKLEVVGIDLQVTNPEDTMSNIVRIGKIAFKMNFAALLEAKYVIELVAVEDLRVGTPRESDGAIKKREKKQKSERTGGDKKGIDPGELAKKFNIFDLDLEKMKDELEIERYISGDLETIKQGEALKEEAEKTALKWKDEFTDMSYYNDIMKIAADVQSFDPRITNPTEAPAKLAQIIETKQKVERIVVELKGKKSDFERDFVKIKGRVESLEEVSRRELEELLNKLNLGEISLDNIGDMIFTDEFNRNLDRGLYWFYKVRPFIPTGAGNKERKAAKEQAEEVEFGRRGYDVAFPITRGYPAFHIKKVSLSTSGEESRFANYPTVRGTVTDIISDQDLGGQPLAMNLSVTLPEFHNLESALTATFDRRGGRSRDNYGLDLKNIPLNNLELAGTNGLPQKLESSSLFVAGELVIDDSYTEVLTSVSLKSIKFSYDESSSLNQFGVIVKDIISSVDEVDFQVRVKIEGEQREFEIKSNLDKLFAGAMERIFREKLGEVKAEFENRFNDYIKVGLGELDDKLRLGEAEALALYREQEKKINGQRAIVEAKLAELEKEVNRYRSELEKRAKEEIQKNLQNVTDKIPNFGF